MFFFQLDLHKNPGGEGLSCTLAASEKVRGRYKNHNDQNRNLIAIYHVKQYN